MSNNNGVDARKQIIDEYMQAGFSLLPLNGKSPFQRGWPQKPGLSVDEALRRVGTGNIGMRTGAPSGRVYALDVDKDWEKFAGFNADLLKRVRWIKTSGGRGRLLVKGEGWEAFSKKQPWGELLGDGHQCVLPPSIHPDSKQPYTWVGNSSLPIVLATEPETLKFTEPLKRQIKPAKLSDSEWETLKVLISIFGCEPDHIDRKEAYFSCPWHPPDRTASFSYSLANHKFFCFHGDSKLKGHGLDELRMQLTEEKTDEDPENFLICDRVDTPLQAPEMVFTDLWPARTLGLFTGDGGTGKTHFALQLIMSIASGREIEGTPFRCPAPRPVVYISQEDEADFLLGELLHQYPDLKSQPEISQRIRIISTAIQGSNLFLTDNVSRRYITKNLPEGGVLFLDSFSTFVTSNENDNTQLLRNEIRFLREIVKIRKASPFSLHHRPKPNPQTGIQSSSRGGTALPNSCRFHIMMERSGVRRRLSFEKVSRGAELDPLNLVLDEERRLFVLSELDRYVAAFGVNEELTTSQFMERIGKDPGDEREKKQVLDILRNRAKGGRIEKIKEGKKGQDTVWKRLK